MAMRSAKGLPDHIRPGVRVLFVGINPGLRSAAVGHHFAGYSNRFWRLLSDSRLVPVSLTFHDDARLPEWRIGLTNMVGRPTAGIGTLKPADYARGRRRLLNTIRRYHPKVVALLGVTLVPKLFPGDAVRSGARGKRVRAAPRLLSQRLAGASVLVLPNPSGRNAHYSYEEMLRAFRALKRWTKE